MKIEQLNKISLDTARGLIGQADPAQLSPAGSRTALMYACTNPTADGVEIVRLLLSKGVNPTERDKNAATALMYAIGNHNVQNALQIIDILCRAGADINAVDYKGDSALMRAVQPPCRDIDVIKCLIVKGADLSIVNHEGETALSLATEAHYREAVNILKK